MGYCPGQSGQRARGAKLADNGSQAAVRHTQSESQEEPTNLRSRPLTGRTNEPLDVAAPSARAVESLQDGNAAKKTAEGEEAERDEGGSDYLGCAQDRVLVLWGQSKASDMRERLVKRIKFCDDKCSEPDE